MAVNPKISREACRGARGGRDGREGWDRHIRSSRYKTRTLASTLKQARTTGGFGLEGDLITDDKSRSGGRSENIS